MSFFKKFLGITLTASLLLITGCGNTATTSESPDAVILKMQQRWQEKKSESKTGKTDGSINISVESPQVKINGAGEVDIQFNGEDINNPQFDMELSLDGDATMEDFSGSLKLKLAMKMLDKILYMNLGSLEVKSSEDPTIAQQVQMFVPMFANQWFKMPLPEETQNPLALQGPLNFGGPQLSDEQITQIEELAKTIQVLEFKEDMGSGNGKYRYKVAIHKENGLKFIEKMTKAMGQEFTDEEKDNLKTILDNLDTSLEITIDASTYDLEEVKNGVIKIESDSEEAMIIKVDGKLSDKKTVMDIEMSGNQDIGGNINISFDLNTDNNAKVKVEAPENAQEFDPLSMMGAGTTMDTEL